MINVPPAGWTLLRISRCVLTGSAALENAGGISFRGGGVSVPWKESPIRGAKERNSLEAFARCLMICDFDVGLGLILSSVEVSN